MRQGIESFLSPKQQGRSFPSLLFLLFIFFVPGVGFPLFCFYPSSIDLPEQDSLSWWGEVTSTWGIWVQEPGKYSPLPRMHCRDMLPAHRIECEQIGGKIKLFYTICGAHEKYHSIATTTCCLSLYAALYYEDRKFKLLCTV